MEFIPLLVFILIVIYIVVAIMNPEKHKFGLVVMAIIAALFGSSSNKKNKR